MKNTKNCKNKPLTSQLCDILPHLKVRASHLVLAEQVNPDG